MKPRKLLVAHFKTAQDNSYLYDVISNRVFYAPDVFVNVLNEYANGCSLEEIIIRLDEKYNHKIIMDAYSKIHNCVQREHCFFRTEADKKHISDSPKFDISENEYWEKLFYQVGCNQLILTITEDCNLRCKYCTYSSGFYPHQRSQTNKGMSFEVAKTAIDYFCELRKRTCIPLPQPFITFYGGEPLLHLNLIKQCIEYTESLEKVNDLQFGFGLTTNATLITAPIIEYFIAKKINLTISLDGPKSIHDTNRVFPSGRGTFDKVMSVLEAIKKVNEDYYNTNVLFACTYDWGTDMEVLNQFFVENKDRLPLMGLVNAVSDVETTYYGRFSSDEKERFHKGLQQLGKMYYETKTKKCNYDTSFLDRLFTNCSLVLDVRSF